MKSGYRLLWSDHALEQLRQTFAYLEENFTERECRRLATRLDFTLRLIKQNPTSYPRSEHAGRVRRAVVNRHNTIYYRVSEKQIEILSFFSNRQDPDRLPS